MHFRTLAACGLLLAGATSDAYATELAEHAMTIIPAGAQVPIVGPASTFTGQALVEPLLMPKDNKQVDLSAAYVTFEVNARSAWHSHPKGQLLVVTAGQGWIQQQGQQRRTIHAGDVIWTPPGVWHWHGATDSSSMTHMAIQQSLEGQNVQWGDKVSEPDYLAQ